MSTVGAEVGFQSLCVCKQLLAAAETDTTGSVRGTNNRHVAARTAEQWAESLKDLLSQGELQIQVIIVCRFIAECDRFAIVTLFSPPHLKHFCGKNTKYSCFKLYF